MTRALKRYHSFGYFGLLILFWRVVLQPVRVRTGAHCWHLAVTGSQLQARSDCMNLTEVCFGLFGRAGGLRAGVVETGTWGWCKARASQ